MKRIRLRATALLIALTLFAPLCALPAGAIPVAGREYYMMSYQSGGYSHGERLASLYGNALFSGVRFNGGIAVTTSAPGKDALLGELDAFKNLPDEDDITYFHFVGTGYLKDGVAGIQLNGGEELPLADLSDALAALPGTVCAMLDVKAAGASPASFNQQVAQAFSAEKFQYLSACSATDAAFGAASIPRATRAFLIGCGMNLSTGALKAKNWSADANKNFAVSLKEAASYLKGQSKKLKSSAFGLAWKATGSGPNLYAVTGVRSLTMTVPSGVDTRQSSIEIQYEYTPANADVFQLNLASSVPKVASFASSPDASRLAIHRAGTTVLTVRSKHYPYPKKTARLKVSPIRTDSIKMVVDYETTNDQTVEKKAYTLFNALAYVNPTDSAFQEVYWKSSNPKVASVERDKTSSGRIASIYCKAYGDAKITAYTKDGTEASFTLRVPVVEIQGLTPMEDLKLLPGMRYQYGVSAYPEGAIFKISYKSSKPSVASINSVGKVTAKKYGNAVITATCVQNPKLKVIYTIRVVPNACTWPKPDADQAAALGDGVHYVPKSLSISGKWLLGAVYVVNNTDAPFVGDINMGVGVRDNRYGPGEGHTNFVKKFSLVAPVPARGIGTYTYRMDKSSKLGGVLGKKLSSFILPWDQLRPYVRKRTY